MMNRNIFFGIALSLFSLQALATSGKSDPDQHWLYGKSARNISALVRDISTLYGTCGCLCMVFWLEEKIEDTAVEGPVAYSILASLALAPIGVIVHTLQKHYAKKARGTQ